MTAYMMSNVAIGTDAAKPTKGDMVGYDKPPFGMYIAYDTGTIYISNGDAWSTYGTIVTPSGAVGGDLAGSLPNPTIASFTNSITVADAKNIAVGTSTGTKIGTATTQKLGFFNAAPVAQQSITGALSTVADAPAKAVLTAIVTALANLGLAANGTT